MPPGSSLTRNPISVVGAWLTTLGAFAFITYYVAALLGWLENPYSGLFGFVVAPAVFLLGLALIPIGMWREARRRHRGKEPWAWPAINLGNRRTRNIVLAVLVLTVVNLAIVAVAGLGALHYMETDQFCGQVCHVPMKPEFTAHQLPPHASVDCVRCHVSPGASGTIRAKLNGARQAWEFMTGTFHRPIPTPARNIPTAADTCVHCHSAGQPQRDLTITKREYADDETNTETATTFLMQMQANHWHARSDVRVEYVATDPTRDTIPYVRVTEPGGGVTEYFAAGVTTRPNGDLRRMDCLDCHTRPAHAMSASAEQAVDRAIAAGEISRDLPFVKREAVAALKVAYDSETAALEGIRRRMSDFYQARKEVPAAEVARAIAALERTYRANVFPEMKITWGTYRSQISHIEPLGCFRCHDEEHKSTAGKTIRQDCELCHKELSPPGGLTP